MSVEPERERSRMREPASACTVAAGLLPSIALTPSQTAQLRAIDHKYQQSLYTMLAGAPRAPTATEQSGLDDAAARDILNMLTPEQRALIRA